MGRKFQFLSALLWSRRTGLLFFPSRDGLEAAACELSTLSHWYRPHNDTLTTSSALEPLIFQSLSTTLFDSKHNANTRGYMFTEAGREDCYG